MEGIITPQKSSSFSKTQIIFLVAVLVVAGAFFLDRQFGLFDRLFRERVEIPSGTPYAEALVIGAYEGVVLAERVMITDAQGNALSEKMEILTDEKTVFAKLTSFGPIKISYAKLSEGDVVWAYNRIRSLEEAMAAPADPALAIPFEDMAKNPRERLRADFVVKVGE